MIVPIGLFLAIAERRMWRRLLALGATAATALGVALTFSRGAAVGFVMVAVIMALLGYVRLRYVGLVLIAGVLLLTAVPAYGERLASLVEVSSTVSDAGLSEADGAIQSRITEGLSALLAFADHPIIGVGPGGFPGVYRHYAELVGIRVLAADREAHDLYAGLLAELGLAGGIVFAVIMGLTIRDLLRGRRATAVIDPMMSALCTGFMLSIVTYLTTGIFLHMSFVRYFWMMLALAGAAAVIALAVARQHAALAAEASDDGATATVVIEPPAVPVEPAGVTPRRAPRRSRRPVGSPAQLPQSQSVQP
jgi:O-antigen ligase